MIMQNLYKEDNSMLSYHKSKEIKNIIGKCEIKNCTLTDISLLECHHIIPQKDKYTNEHFSHSFMNLAILCPNHHAMADSGIIKINGRIKTTVGYMLDYKEDFNDTI